MRDECSSLGVDDKTGRCHRCAEPDGEYRYGPMMHPGTFWCERCEVETATIAAREAAANLSELERRLEALGGPAERVVCGYVYVLINDDQTPFGAFCELDKGHAGHHKAAA